MRVARGTSGFVRSVTAVLALVALVGWKPAGAGEAARGEEGVEDQPKRDQPAAIATQRPRAGRRASDVYGLWVGVPNSWKAVKAYKALFGIRAWIIKSPEMNRLVGEAQFGVYGEFWGGIGRPWCEWTTRRRGGIFGLFAVGTLTEERHIPAGTSPNEPIPCESASSWAFGMTGGYWLSWAIHSTQSGRVYLLGLGLGWQMVTERVDVWVHSPVRGYGRDRSDWYVGGPSLRVVLESEAELSGRFVSLPGVSLEATWDTLAYKKRFVLLGGVSWSIGWRRRLRGAPS